MFSLIHKNVLLRPKRIRFLRLGVGSVSSCRPIAMKFTTQVETFKGARPLGMLSKTEFQYLTKYFDYPKLPDAVLVDMKLNAKEIKRVNKEIQRVQAAIASLEMDLAALPRCTSPQPSEIAAALTPSTISAAGSQASSRNEISERERLMLLKELKLMEEKQFLKNEKQSLMDKANGFKHQYSLLLQQHIPGISNNKGASPSVT